MTRKEFFSECAKKVTKLLTYEQATYAEKVNMIADMMCDIKFGKEETA